MKARTGLLWLLWLTLMAGSVVQISRTPVVTDVSSFLPGPADAAQRLMIAQLRDGLSTRILVMGLQLPPIAKGVHSVATDASTAAQSAALIAASKALREKLATDSRLSWVSNGNLEALTAERDLVFARRYLLSPATQEPQFALDGLKGAFAELERELVSHRSALIRPIATADPTLQSIHLLDSSKSLSGSAGAEGVWLAQDGRVALLLMETAALGSDIAAMREVITSLRQTAQQQLENWPKSEVKPTVEFAGTGYFNVASHDAIGVDAERLAIVALLMVAAVLWTILRSLRFLALALLPVASGALAGFAAVGWFDGAVHGITVAFGVTLIGEAVDYAIYTFVQAESRNRFHPQFWRQIALAVLTSLIGFVAMYFSGFNGLQQLGLFSVVGLIVAALCTRYLLPKLLLHYEIKPLNADASRPTLLLERLSWLPSLLQRLRAARWALAVFAFLMAGVLVTRHANIWDDSLDSLSASTPAENARDLQFRNAIGIPDMRVMVAVTGATLEEALQRTEAATPVLDQMVAARKLSGFDSPAQLLPSDQRQRQRQLALPAENLLRQQVSQALHGGKFKPAAFEPFVKAVAEARTAPLIRQADYANTLLGHWLDAQIVRSADGVSVLVLLRGASSASAVKQGLMQAALPGVALIDLRADVEKLVAGYREQALIAALFGATGIFAVLMIQLRRTRAVVSMMATIISTVTITSALLLLFRGQLTVFNLVSLLLVVGVASNYTLFFATLPKQPERRFRASLSVLLAAASTFIGFAVLAFSATPILAMIGLTVAIGVVVGLVASIVFSVDEGAE